MGDYADLVRGLLSDPEAIIADVESGRHVFRGEKPIRITLDLPPGLHRAVKLRAIATGKTLRAIVIEAVNAIGIVEP